MIWSTNWLYFHLHHNTYAIMCCLKRWNIVKVWVLSKSLPFVGKTISYTQSTESKCAFQNELICLYRHLCVYVRPNRPQPINFFVSVNGWRQVFMFLLQIPWFFFTSSRYLSFSCIITIWKHRRQSMWFMYYNLLNTNKATENQRRIDCSKNIRYEAS